MSNFDLFPDSETLRAVVRMHGGDPKFAYAFDEDLIELLPYATLRDQRTSRSNLLRPIVGIYVWQDAPLILLIDGDRLKNRNHLTAIRRIAAFRGDIPYLGVFMGGRLDVRTVGLSKGSGTKVDFGRLDVIAMASIPYIASARPALRSQGATVAQVVLSLLDKALTSLSQHGLSELESISLAGRALFSRFLADRDLPLGPHMETRKSDVAFANPELARLTCKWLDVTFNGNLLTFDYARFDKMPEEVFGVLVDIMRRAPDGQMQLGWEQRWDSLDFAYIPVGVLSQVYEQYLKAHEPGRQKKEGSYYTPFIIADLMVKATIQGIDIERRAEARFLDPAAGAGVFLITAFRQLVAERWRRDGVRPNTVVLRQILYNQIAGFDINEAALRFAALGLYLVSIELDPEPEPVSKLAFCDLRGTVLYKPEAQEEDGANELAALGSLGPFISSDHDCRYDVVIGNPPWKTGSTLARWSIVEKTVREIASSRCDSQYFDTGASFSVDAINGEYIDPRGDERNSSSKSSHFGKPKKRVSAAGAASAPSRRDRSLLPNNALDLPFVWLASKWARPDAQIAFALHGRLLFQQSEGMPYARASLFTAFDVTSVINGALLRKTKVWPQITAPFCILFAKNRTARPGMAFRFITPREEPLLNKVGLFRLDAANAPMLRTQDIISDPLRLKTLMRASELDLEIRQRITSEGHPTFLQCIEQLGGASGVGVQALRPSSKTRSGKELPGADASYLRKLPYLRSGMPDRVIDTKQLPVFLADRIHDPRDARIFEGPLLLVDQTMRANAPGIAVGFSQENLVYSESHYGYGLTGDAAALGPFLAAVLRSSFARWWLLITSGKYGFERDVVEKATIDKLPIPSSLMSGRDNFAKEFPNLTYLGNEHSELLIELAIAKAFGLEDSDMQIIRDTLRYAFPEKVRRVTSERSFSSFLRGVRLELGAWERELNIEINATPTDIDHAPAWRFVALTVVLGSGELPIPSGQLLAFVNAADESGSTEVYYPDDDGRLWIGLLAQPRYWTFSQGIRVARYIIWNHIEFLSGHSDSMETH